MVTAQRIEKECAGCNTVFIPTRNDKRYQWCSKRCRAKHTYQTQRIASVTHTCAYCSRAYHPTAKSKGKYCSRECARNDMPRRISVEAGQRRIRNYAMRLERNDGKFCAISITPCICCESGLVGPKPSEAWASRFCGSCKRALGNAIGTHAGRIDFLKARLHGRECRVCGGLFKPYQETTSVCSKACEKQTEEYKRVRLAHKLKRRAMKRNNGPHHCIDPIAVFERGGWTCYLCGIDTPRYLRGTHDDRAPEMDHIRPLSKRGPHTLDNVACACRKCNQDKSDKLMVRVGDLWIVDPGIKPDQSIQFCLL